MQKHNFCPTIKTFIQQRISMFNSLVFILGLYFRSSPSVVTEKFHYAQKLSKLFSGIIQFFN